MPHGAASLVREHGAGMVWSGTYLFGGDVVPWQCPMVVSMASARRQINQRHTFMPPRVAPWLLIKEGCHTQAVSLRHVHEQFN